MSSKTSFARVFFALVVVACSLTAVAQKAGDQHQNAIKAALGACDTAHDICLKACTTAAGCNDCEAKWRACKAPINPDIDALAKAGDKISATPSPASASEWAQCSVPDGNGGTTTKNYDPTKQCCKPGEGLVGYDRNSECCNMTTGAVLSHPPQKITDLSNCAPDDRTLSGKAPSFNACGSDTPMWWKDVNLNLGKWQIPIPDSPSSAWVPENPNAWFGGPSFESSCNDHDMCYGKCNVAKATCDNNFRQSMHTKCDESAHNVITKGYCSHIADIYADQVAEKGETAYVSGQQEACECCGG